MDDRTKKRAQFLIDVAYIAVVALIAYLSVKYAVKWILPFILAFCIVSAIHPVITRIVRVLKIKQEVVAIIVMVLIYATVGTLLFLLVMQLVFGVRDALALLPDYYTNSIGPTINSLSQSFSSFLRDLPEPWQQQAAGMQGDVASAIQSFLISVSQRGISALTGFTGSIPSFMIALVFTVMLSFFISMQYDKIILFIKTQLPPRAKLIIRDTRLIIVDTAFKYLRALLTLMLITFAELAAGLLVLGQKNAIPIAVGIAIFDALPFFGTGTIVIPWALIELIQGNFTFAVGLLILYAIVVFVRSIFEPKIVGDKLGLNPVVSLVSIYLGFKLFGVIGMIFMPIITQIILELHREGSIKLFHEAFTQDINAE